MADWVRVQTLPHKQEKAESEKVRYEWTGWRVQTTTIQEKAEIEKVRYYGLRGASRPSPHKRRQEMRR
jgi:hypothetical protein